ncbi:toxin-antitoxin system YwqK family antitoxin [Helicobacter bilis]|uniref:toxin-antitoxin system YwqK family antitoxin n=1 Tax=Helicobacter bilis TaxID=37372 RepID=UPI002557D3BA|nr:hypothetical protein [Helicobacter bilis]
MINFKKMAIGFGLVSVITLQGLQANELKECKSEADKKTGCVKMKYYANGDIREERPYKDGKEHGSIKSYYENGKLKFEIPTENGEPNGIAKLYYENGNLNTQANKRSKKHYSGLFNAKHSNPSTKSKMQCYT